MKSKYKFDGLIGSDIMELSDRSVVEQASGWLTASYKATLIAPGAVIADLTAGLGIDTIAFSTKASIVYAIEKELSRSMALSTNLQRLGIFNVKVINEDSCRWIEQTTTHFDMVYIDPARRTYSGKRVFLLQDCSPDILFLLPRLKKVCKRCLIKVSPLFDLKELERLLPQLTSVRIIEVKREVKELLLELDFISSDKNEKPVIECIILDNVTTVSKIAVSSADDDLVRYVKDIEIVEKGGYVYEPSSSIMKSGFFGSLFKSFPLLQKFSSNSHLFFSKEKYENFPGRVFKIKDFLTSKDLKRAKGKRYNVISRNHPAKSEELQSRFGFVPSDREFLIASSVGNKKLIIEAEKI